MKLTEHGAVNGSLNTVIFVGALNSTAIISSEGDPYYIGKLLNPVTIHCSVDKEIESFETDELYVRERDVQSDKWVALDPKKILEGYSIPGYKTDFSKGQKIAIYQETTIRAWGKDNRKNYKDGERSSINELLKARKAARDAKKD